MERQKQAQIDLHRALAEEYDRVRTELLLPGMFHDYWNMEVAKWLPPRRDSRVLDNMCGTGHFLDYLSTHYSFVTGADISSDMMLRTRAGTRQMLKGLVRCDVDLLPFEDASFDVVNFRGALHHVNPVTKALQETHRVLRPGGMVILSEPCDDFFLVRKIRELMYRSLNYFGHEEKTFLSKELIASLKSAGFEIHGMKRFGFVAYTLLAFPDIIPMFRYFNHMPLAKQFGACLIGLDRILAKVPVIKNWSLMVFIAARKPA